MPTIHLTPAIAVDADALVFHFVRASGPGGQNVNKVATAVELRFDIAASPALDARLKARLARLAGSRMTNEGVLILFVQTHRSQERNRAEALERLRALVAAAAIAPKTRVKTRPTLGSRLRRTDEKVRRGATKRLRGRPDD